MSQKYDALVLDARLRQSLVTIRSLGRRGLRVAALGTSTGLPAFSSRWCQHSFQAPTYEQDPEPFLAFVTEVLDRYKIGVVITSSDDVVALIRQHRERFAPQVAFALAKEPALGIAISKEQTLEIAQQLGIGIPRGVKVETTSDVESALREVGLPAVVKPIESWVWDAQEQKGKRLVAKLVTTPDEARRAVEELTGTGVGVLFQQFLSGRREAVNLLYAHGRIHARFAQWARRTHPPLGGVSVFRQSIAVPPDIGDHAERLVREIALEGYSEVEFRRDDAGKPYLMEINPRLSASIEVAVRAGVDFPYLLYQWARGEQIDKVEGYREGVWMRFLGGDIMTTIESLKQRGRPGIAHPTRAIFDFWSAFLTPAGWDYLAWSDPLPALTATTTFTRRWVGGAINKRLVRLSRRVNI